MIYVAHLLTYPPTYKKMCKIIDFFIIPICAIELFERFILKSLTCIASFKKIYK